MFDCVLPTRLGRHGTAFSDEGYIKLRNAKYASDHSPLDPTGTGYASQFTKAYLHHLIRENEMLGGIILSLHNVSYLHRLTEKLKQDILVS
ncbi:MAG: tRNA-guanine transglycosylase [Candidatus Peribacteria bacterium]|nr:MAG: tRNA-guanine transglycosylase [Candidatus Peribacteria bacterium]